jgi:hypothetical protein
VPGDQVGNHGVTVDNQVTLELTGPGSAWMELDAALHRAIGVAAAVTTWLTTRTRARR